MLLIINDLLGDIAISDTKLNCLSFHFWYTIFLLYIEQFYQHVYILYPVILQRIRGMENGSVFIGKDRLVKCLAMSRLIFELINHVTNFTALIVNFTDNSGVVL